jgi:hypothetical protein
VGGTCGTHRVGERCLQDFGSEARKVRDHWENPGVGGRITLRWTWRQGSMGRTRFSWLRIGSIGGLV